MTLVAARDLSPTGIRVVTIAPGTILRPAYGKAGDQLEASWGPQVPHSKWMGRPGEHAALVQAIAENDYLNGEVIRLDGLFVSRLSNAQPKAVEKPRSVRRKKIFISNGPWLYLCGRAA